MKPIQGKTKIKRSTIHGWGVFAAKDIRRGETIELMPALCVLSQHVTNSGRKSPHSPLNTHAFFPMGMREHWFGTGTCSFYNAASRPNAEYECIIGVDENEGDWVEIVALRTIKAGQEITLGYLQDSDS